MTNTTAGSPSPNITDMFLDMHLEGVIRSGMGGVTLFVNGNVITGRPVSKGDFFRTTSIPNDDPEWDSLRAAADRWDQEDEEIRSLRQRDPESLTEEELELANQSRYFINLVEAKFQTGAGALAPTAGSGVCMQIRTDSVDGWTPGTLGTDAAQ